MFTCRSLFFNLCWWSICAVKGNFQYFWHAQKLCVHWLHMSRVSIVHVYIWLPFTRNYFRHVTKTICNKAFHLKRFCVQFDKFGFKWVHCNVKIITKQAWVLTVANAFLQSQMTQCCQYFLFTKGEFLCACCLPSFIII